MAISKISNYVWDIENNIFWRFNAYPRNAATFFSNSQEVTFIFKVGFGNVWKDNLSELSGGQRSLVALSLILAMLLLKPAPIYILDEVDAALDLSHTQNIGSMLKNHFKKSQFIVVSLKDGMYENASVLYRTKFVDGVSTVSRMQASVKKPTTADKENQPNKRKNPY